MDQIYQTYLNKDVSSLSPIVSHLGRSVRINNQNHVNDVSMYDFRNQLELVIESYDGNTRTYSVRAGTWCVDTIIGGAYSGKPYRTYFPMGNGSGQYNFYHWTSSRFVVGATLAYAIWGTTPKPSEKLSDIEVESVKNILLELEQEEKDSQNKSEMLHDLTFPGWGHL
ncbi:MAG: hypothetical protein SH817_04695 [Leptospira sp.]|nr:hypothetical protein [Leptospira sp.]